MPKLRRGPPKPTRVYLFRLFWLSLCVMVLTAVALRALDDELITDVTPYGIVSFEFCGFTGTCETALSQWSVHGHFHALLSLGIDYLFLVTYPAVIALALLLLRDRVPPRIGWVNFGAAWLCPVIALADAVENYALIRIVLRGMNGAYGEIAGYAALVKFGLLAVVVLWLLFVAGWILHDHRMHARIPESAPDGV